MSTRPKPPPNCPRCADSLERVSSLRDEVKKACDRAWKAEQRVAELETLLASDGEGGAA